ncbi:MAG: glycosyltransferase family 4 protein [Actinomycetota bacterium]|nr:glycosyltransferase family 4 protein [Actinomycetota bacterium]
MRVSIVCPYSWSVPGGVANHIEALAGRLRERGHAVEVIAPADTPVKDVYGVGRSVGVRFNGSVARIAFGPRVAARIRSRLREFDPAVVHVHEPFAPSASMLATLVSPAPVVATFHSSMPDSKVLSAASPVLRPLWRKIAVKIAVSEEARRTVERVFGAGIRIIPNGVALERFSALGPAGEGKHILFVGRLEPRKGASVLLDAFARVHAADARATLTIVGEGPERRALERRAAALPVTFRGRLDHEALAGAFGEAAIVCAPSLGGESFGIVLLEAMAAGRPVVATSIPGYAAVARDGIDAALVPPGDVQALSTAVRDLLDDPKRLLQLAAAGRERAARFSWDVVAGQIEEVYRHAAGR